ncbi:hypothetical protein EUX98_g2049 [Antrodiella citrinella]|uniref:Uncharacterized protein n=1 Tax=Antrodiella citrinella TaxID=2447956 RepID=A0A4S4N2X0_9APHY|nr:hypothetical protein EUX98_g2049 [Antrodiella citrinella]
MLLTLVYLLVLSAQVVRGQVVVNGQIFTRGLAIIDSPAPGTPLHAGSTAAIAIDVSGDGHLTPDALYTNSGSSTHFTSLEIYLTSPALNVTVSQGPGLLQQESGSTVKHITWLIDNCVPSGNYNLTFYEGSFIQSTPYFTITPLPVSVQNTNPTGACANGTNAVQTVPQASTSLLTSPWLDQTQTSIVPFPSATASNAFNPHVMSSVREVLLLAGAAAYLTYWV